MDPLRIAVSVGVAHSPWGTPRGDSHPVRQVTQGYHAIEAGTMVIPKPCHSCPEHLVQAVGLANATLAGNRTVSRSYGLLEAR